MYIPRPAKLLFKYDDTWNRFIDNNQLFRSTTRAMLKHARCLGLKAGIFCALHTYGRQLNQHPHIHLSVTRNDLTKYSIWKPIFFKKKDIEKVWH
ncbi:transposase, partial [Providencia sp. AGC89]